MKTINNYSKNIVDTYYPNGVGRENDIRMTASGSTIILNIVSSVIESKLESVVDSCTGGMAKKGEKMVSAGKCTTAGISYMINDTAIEILTICKGNKDTIRSLKKKRDNAEEKFLENVKKEYRIIFFAGMLALSNIAYEMEEEKGMKHDVKNLAEYSMYKYKLTSDCIDKVIEITTSIIGTSEGERVGDVVKGIKKSLMPDWIEKEVEVDGYVFNEGGRTKSLVNYGIKVEIEAIEDGIKSLKRLENEEGYLYYTLEKVYLCEAEEFNNEMNYIIEWFLEDIRAKISVIGEKVNEEINRLESKKKTLEEYLRN